MSQWTSSFSLIGPTGPTGPTGSTGWTGPMGSVYLGQGSSEDPTNPGYAGTGPNDSTYLNFVGPTGMAYSIGQNVLVTYTANPTAYSFYATVLSYNSTTGNTEVNNVRDIVGNWGDDGIWAAGGTPVALTMNIVGLDGPTGPVGPAGPGGTFSLTGTTYGDYVYYDGSNWVVGTSNISLGSGAGQISQGAAGVALGQNAGNTSQGANAVAIGYGAGSNAQGSNAVAIGFQAGNASQPAGSIVLNAGATGLNGVNAGLYIKPIREVVANGQFGVYYDTTTHEVIHNSVITISSISSLVVGANIIPDRTLAYSLGTYSLRYTDAFFGPGTVNIAGPSNANATIGTDANGIIYTQAGFASPYLNVGPAQLTPQAVGGWRIGPAGTQGAPGYDLVAQQINPNGGGLTGPAYSLINAPTGPLGPTGPGQGGAYGYFGAFHSSSNQTAANTTTAYAIYAEVQDGALDVSMVTDGTHPTRMTFANPGTYNIQFSIQFANTGPINDVNIWFRHNGTDEVASNSRFSIPAEHGGVNGHLIAALNYILTVAAGDYVQVMWQTESTTISIAAFPAGTTPTIPTTPSVILTAQQVMNIELGPTGPTGPTAPITNFGTQRVLTALTSTTTKAETNLTFNGERLYTSSILTKDLNVMSTLYAPHFQLISTNNILYYNSTSGMVTYAPYPNLSQYATISTSQILYNKTLSSVSIQASTILNGTLNITGSPYISTNHLLFYNSTTGLVTYEQYPNLSQYATVSSAQILYNKTLSSMSLQASTIVNGTFTINGSGGSNGQVLAATGSGLTWTSPANLPFVSFTKQSDQDISTQVVVFPATATLSSGTSFGNMSSGWYTFTSPGNYQITATFNLSLFGQGAGFPNADLWGVFNNTPTYAGGSTNIRYLQLAVNGMKKGSVSEIVNVPSTNTKFYWWCENAVRVNGTGPTTTKLSFVQLASLSAS